jgi:hypothetical protein
MDISGMARISGIRAFFIVPPSLCLTSTRLVSDINGNLAHLVPTRLIRHAKAADARA